MLAELIAKGEKEYAQLEEARRQAQDALENGEELMAVLETQYERLVSWADMYDTANIATRKMIVNQLIRRVDVGRGYQLNVEFTIDYRQFMLGLDACRTA